MRCATRRRPGELIGRRTERSQSTREAAGQERRLAPRPAPGDRDLVRARVPDAVRRWPGGVLLRRPPVKRSATATSRTTCGPAACRKSPSGPKSVRGLLKPDQGGQAKPFNAVRIEDPKLVEELERHGVVHRGEVASRWIGERPWLGACRSCSSSRSGPSSSAGWAAPKAASCRSRAARPRSTPTTT